MSNTSFYSKYHNGKVSEETVNSIYNFEVIRDYCGCCLRMMDLCEGETAEHAEYLHHLPEAIDVLVKIYHINYHTNGGFIGSVPAKELVKNIQDVILRELEPYKDTLMRSVTWKSEPLLNGIYYDVFVEDEFLGPLLKIAAKSIIDSDYNRAKKYIKENVSDPEMRKILDKAINHHEPDHIKFYFSEFSEKIKELGCETTRFMDSVGGTRFYYDANGNEIGSRRLW